MIFVAVETAAKKASGLSSITSDWRRKGLLKKSTLLSKKYRERLV